MASRHGKTTSDRSRHRAAGATDRGGGHCGRILATMSGGAAAGFVRGDAGTNGGDARGGARARGAPPSRLSPAKTGIARRSSWGWTPPVPTPGGGRMCMLETLVGKGRCRPSGRRISDSGGTGAALGPAGQTLGGLPAPGPPGLAQGGPRHAPPQKPTRGSGGLEKKLPEVLATRRTRDVVQGRPVRLMFQDAARFGRLGRMRRGGSPAPPRPVGDNGYERELR